jgi:hypothetical protein
MLPVLYFCVCPAYTMFQKNMQIYATNIEYNSNYKLHTTPLPENVVKDICSKFNIEKTNEKCKENALVYAPELFDEIKIYFNDLPEEEKTFDAVQNKLGAYLVDCEKPSTDGHYRCKYDIRGDKVLPIFFYFNKDHHYYKIIANKGIGGS